MGLLLLFVTGAALVGETAVGTRPLTSHPAAVQVLAFSPDGRRLYSGCAAGVIRVTEVASGKTVRSLDAHPAKPSQDWWDPARGVLALAVSADGATLFSGGSDSALYAWDVATGKSKQLVGDQFVAGLALSPDGKLLAATGYKGDLRLIDWKEARVVHKIKGKPERITAAVFSPDGKTLFTGGVTANQTFGNYARIELDVIRTWDVATGREGPPLPGKGHRLVPVGDGFVSSGIVRVLEANHEGNREIRQEIQSQWNEDVTEFWDGAGRRTRSPLHGHGPLVALSADGKFLASADSRLFLESGLNDASFWGVERSEHKPSVWNVARRQLIFQIQEWDPTALALSPDGKTLALGTRRGKVLVVDLEGEKRKFLEPRTREELWERLAEKRWEESYRCQWALEAEGEKLLPFLDRKLPVAPKSDPAAIRKWIAELDSERINARDAAAAELERVGPTALPLVKQALQAGPSLVATRRLKALLEKYLEELRGPEARRRLRAVAILEEIGTPAARRLLDKAARGEDGLPLTEAAKGAVGRMKAARQPPEVFPLVREVEWEALKDHCAALLKEADSGLPDETRRRLEALLSERGLDPEQAVETVQDLLDPHCLVAVGIDREGRIAAARGPATAVDLVNEKPRALLVKVHNEGGVTRALEVAGDQIRGAGQKGEGRWLEAAVTPKTLSGKRLEYALLRLTPHREGVRAAALKFDAGRGAQGLGSHDEVSILFRVREPR